nr:immunoglobulin heavy chain junction region [Mus musculus]
CANLYYSNYEGYFDYW